jgi:hypothetical protein
MCTPLLRPAVPISSRVSSRRVRVKGVAGSLLTFIAKRSFKLPIKNHFLFVIGVRTPRIVEITYGNAARDQEFIGTTSVIGRQAYEEVREDWHPIIFISGKDLTEILTTNGYGTPKSVRQLLLREFPTG